MKDWSAHFEAVSRGATTTASFGGVLEEAELTGKGLLTKAEDASKSALAKAKTLVTSDEAKRYQAPVLLGLLVGVLAKVAGMVGPAPIVLGVLAASGTMAVQSKLAKDAVRS